jgi:hypothetical protein
MSSVSETTQRKRESYLPPAATGVRVLCIGESPPAGGTFFYCGNSGLHDATQEAFKKSIPAVRRAGDFRDAFMRLGCYLEDLSLEPVNDLPNAERLRARKAGIEPLATRIRPFRPRVVVVVGYDVSKHVIRALVNAGHGDVARERLPFPTSRRRMTDGVPYRDVYVEELAALVKRWRRRQILAPF